MDTKKRDSAWMTPETYKRFKKQKHRFYCDTMASILAVAVEVLEMKKAKQ